MRDREPAELPLFDVDRLVPMSCPIEGCHAIRQPAEQTATPDCRIDRERSTGDYARRPLGCLNDPSKIPIPY